MIVAYLFDQFPAVTHIPALREISALRQLGLNVVPLALVRNSRLHLLSPPDRLAFACTHGLNRSRHAARLADHLLAIYENPFTWLVCLLATLLQPPAGLRAKFIHLCEFCQAIQVWAHCRREGIDHLHVTGAARPARIAFLASRFAAAGTHPLTFSLDLHLTSGTPESPALPRMSASASFILCGSDACRSHLMTLIPAAHWDILRVARPAIDLSPPSNSASLSASDLLSPERPIQILCAARLIPARGQHALLEALAELRRRGRSVHLTLVGDGPQAASLGRQAMLLGLLPHVTFTGTLCHEQLLQLYPRADIFCLPSLTGGSTAALLEAMAAGLPVVASRLSDLPEILDQGRSALLVTPGRIDHLAEALDFLVDSPSARRHMGAAAHLRAQRHHDLHHRAFRLRNLFLRAARTRQPAAPRIPAPSSPVHTGVPS